MKTVRVIPIAILAVFIFGSLSMPASANESREFRTCRIALILAKNNSNATSLSEETVSLMLRQTEFVMAENAFSAPPNGVQNGIDRIRESEAWFLAFSKEIGRAKTRLASREALDEALIGCQSQIWEEVEVIIEGLIAFRQEAWMEARPKPEVQADTPTLLGPLKSK